VPCLFNITQDPCEHTNLAAAMPAKTEQLKRRLAAGYFNLIVVTTQSNKCCGLSRCYGAEVSRALNEYIGRTGNATAVATVDASDGFGGCGGATFAKELERVDVHFLREVDRRHNGRTAALVEPPATSVITVPPGLAGG